MGANHSNGHKTSRFDYSKRRATFSSMPSLGQLNVRKRTSESLGNSVISSSTINSAGRDINTTHNTVHYCQYSPTQNTSNDNVFLAVLAWLSTVNFRDIHQDSLFRRVPGTGVRFLGSQKFRRWKECQSSTLWGIGMPGAGKTVLASIVVEHLQRLGSPMDSLVLFAYCRYNHPLSVSDILAALLRQALEDHHEILPVVERLRSLHRLQETRPTQEELLCVLLEVSKGFGRVTLVLDGLDELRPDIRHSLLQVLLSLDIHLLLMSRPIEYDKDVIRNMETFDVRANIEDVHLLLSRRIGQYPAFKALLEKESLVEEVIHSVCENAGGMFLHATLQMEALQYCRTVGDIRLALRSLPPDLDSMYIDTLTRIRNSPSFDAARGLRTLLWLVFAARPLRMNELQYILATSPITHNFDPEHILPLESILGLCQGLVTAERASGIIRLVHYTAQVALERLLLAVDPDPHTTLTLACVAYLKHSNIPKLASTPSFRLETVIEKFPLTEYAYKYWAYHLKRCASPDQIESRVEQFMLECTSFPVIWDDEVISFRPIHLAAWYNIPLLLPCIVNEGYDLNEKLPETGQTPLMVACLSGNRDFVKGLFALCGIQLDTNGTGNRKRNSTSWMSTLTNILRVTTVAVNDCDLQGHTALFLAASRGHAEVVDLLLQAPRVQVNMPDIRGRSPLIIASINGHYEVVQILLAAPETNVNAKDKDGRAALMYSASSGHLEILNALLVRPDIDINAVDNQNLTAVDLSVRGGHLDAVKLLMNQVPGIMIGVATRAKLLILASGLGDHEFVTYLLQYKEL